jgi:hypothetical protein
MGRVLFTIPFPKMHLRELEAFPPEERGAVLNRCLESAEMRASFARRARHSLFAPVYALTLGGLCVAILHWHPSIVLVFPAVAWGVLNFVLGPISDKRILRRLITRDLNERGTIRELDRPGKDA